MRQDPWSIDAFQCPLLDARIRVRIAWSRASSHPWLEALSRVARGGKRLRRASARGGAGGLPRRLLLGAVLLVTTLACQSTKPPLEVVAEVDLDRYAGRWYEIASFPQRFQEGCVATTATYTLRDDGRIRVENECRNGSFDGELRRVEGVAWVTDPAGSQAKLEVEFFWPFSGAYWIIELDPGYRHAVVGHPSRDYLWILARTQTLAPNIYEELLTRIASHGYDLGRLEQTPQPATP